MSRATTACSDQSHCGFTHPRVPVLRRSMKALSPAEWSHVSVLMHGFVWRKAQLLAQRGARIWVGSVIE